MHSLTLFVKTVLFIFVNKLKPSVQQEQAAGSFHTINPAHQDLRWAGLWLAAHKYFEVDRRKGNKLSWQYAPREYHKHFPLPRLKMLHPKAMEACSHGVVECSNDIAATAKDSYSLFTIFQPDASPEEMPPDTYPFETALDLFRYRTTAAYYMCWYAMQKSDFLMNFMEGGNCLSKLDQVQEKKWADINVVDFRNDSYMDPFLCAEIQFCPDPCFGKKSGGSVKTPTALANDKGNPCHHLQDQKCTWDFGKNFNFDSLIKNRFNISCNCESEMPGFEWNSRFGLCIDKDECMDEKPKCTGNRVCQNVVGGFECVCRRGHQVDKRNKCIEKFPLPPHSKIKLKIKPKRQKTAFTAFLENILGIGKSSKD